METRKRLITVLAWLQLGISIFLASTIVWGYVTYQASFGQVVQSITASIGAVSNVVARTAETVEGRRDLLDHTGQMLVVARSLINALKIAVENQARIAPQYLEAIRSAASVSAKLSGTFQSIGDGMSFQVPTGIRMEGYRPIFTMSRPLENPAQKLKTSADEIKAVSESLFAMSASISKDGQSLSSSVITTSEHALKMVEEAEKSLGRLRTEDLPKAIDDLRVTSESLNRISERVDRASHLPIALLIVGLLLAAWCFVHSLNTLMLVSSSLVLRPNDATASFTAR